ncbi:TPR repeat-containing protein [Desulfonatronum thiosulfatophilum]|uniref:TPR repeat-containing protein n=1 Tax=Desulfonatronum thiosulfatophilum TaxID=617002 RepID=A0A1G6DI62_9BACT|nr:nuclear transport factor 2 family protein [Desulfonatronum thiosulfatophilum]SDB44791.1 TPR repeat-containing protein [Desulfonatronum thiosulfatophilum]
MKRITLAPAVLVILLWAATPAVSFYADLDMAQVRMAEERPAEALLAIQEHLRKHPGEPQGLFLKALILERSGRFSEAMDVYRSLIDIHPELPEPYNNLAALLAAGGRFEEAKQTLQQALQTHPSYATAHQNLSRIYSAMAGSAYRRALGNNDDTILVLLDPLDELGVSADTAVMLAAVDRQAQERLMTEAPLSSPAAMPVPNLDSSAVPPSARAPERITGPLPGVSSWLSTPGFATQGMPPGLASALICAPQESPRDNVGLDVTCPQETVPEILADLASSEPPSVSEPSAAAPEAPEAVGARGTKPVLPTPAPETVSGAPEPAAVPELISAPEASATSEPESAPPSVQAETSTADSFHVDVQETVTQVVQDWAKAWASQNVQAYLSFYSDEFKPERGLSLAQWREQRRTRVAAPPFIHVTLSNIIVTVLDENSVQVRFTQRYRSNVVNDQVLKELQMRKENGQWRIVRERLLPR